MTRTNSAEPALTVAGVIDEMLGLGRQKFKSWLPHPFNIATARNSGMRPRARLQRNACTSSAIMLEGAEQHNEIVETRWKAGTRLRPVPRLTTLSSRASMTSLCPLH